MVPHSWKLSREKTFMNFEALWPFTQVFSAKILFSTNLWKFSHMKVFTLKFPAIQYMCMCMFVLSLKLYSKLYKAHKLYTMLAWLPSNQGSRVKFKHLCSADRGMQGLVIVGDQSTAGGSKPAFLGLISVNCRLFAFLYSASYNPLQQVSWWYTPPLLWPGL